MEKERLLVEGCGLEISSSRFGFAEAFKEFSGSTKTTNMNANVFETAPLGCYDLVCAMDIVFQLLSPVSEPAESRLLFWINTSLRVGGRLVAKLRDFEQFKQMMTLADNQVYQFWEEFPAPDPWRYNLNRMTYVESRPDADILWEKLFLKRDSTEYSRTAHVVRPYTEQKFRELAGQYGFAVDAALNQGTGLYTIVARKVAELK